jgi:hypothetical protein
VQPTRFQTAAGEVGVKNHTHTKKAGFDNATFNKQTKKKTHNAQERVVGDTHEAQINQFRNYKPKYG